MSGELLAAGGLSQTSRMAASALRTACLTAALMALAACGTTGKPKQQKASGLMAPITADFFIPANTFDTNGLRKVEAAVASSLTAEASPSAFTPEVQVYFSPNSASYFRKGGLDGSINVLLWERFLKKYEFPHRVLDSVETLEAATPGVLVLPSNVALSQRELDLIRRYRQRGGSVMASWLVGSRDERGGWRGFDAAESLFGIRIEGFTGPQEEDRYLNPAGDSLVSHALPACQRIWTERVAGWYPLRLSGARAAAQVHNWSRTLPEAKANTAMVYDETTLQGGGSSRMVFLGWPERLWMGADPRSHEAILFDSITWLLRQPAAYLATWPHPYRSAYVPIVYMADVFNHNDLPFAKTLQAQGLQATYFLLSFELDKSAPTLKDIGALGHRFGYEGDIYEGFRDEPLETQAQRLETMRQDIEKYQVPMDIDAGFNAPMDDEDANTRTAVAQRPFAYMIASANGTDACLPFFAEQAADTRTEPLVMLPRMHRGAEEMLEDYDEEQAVVSQKVELKSMLALGGLSISRFANQSLLSAEALSELAQAPAEYKATTWLTSAPQLVQWWRERKRVSVELTGTAAAAQLSVTVNGDTPITAPVSVWINLPRPEAVVELTPVGAAPALTVQTEDGLRAAAILTGLPPGQHVWQIGFRQP